MMDDKEVELVIDGEKKPDEKMVDMLLSKMKRINGMNTNIKEIINELVNEDEEDVVTDEEKINITSVERINNKDFSLSMLDPRLKSNGHLAMNPILNNSLITLLEAYIIVLKRRRKNGIQLGH